MYYIIAFVVVVLDQLTKYLIVKNMEIGQSIPLWPGVFQLTSHRNMGAAFGILQNQRTLFIIITVAVIIGIIVSMVRIGRKQPGLSVALALVLGGAIGNFIDRAVTGRVVDFLDFTLIHFPIFNVADSAITIGVALLILDVVLDSKRSSR
ncbi:signal peptidase II [Brevibacillus ginsengisoli]|uniref:signal peptidase II n=1 Tax=Brevibacillus ginsengisoli TaxID=363854 RepID=UPI003CF84A53